MNITVRYFAAARHAVGSEQESLASTATTVGGLVAELAARGGQLAELLGRCTFLVNEAVAAVTGPLRDGDVVDVLPPVAGG